MNPMIKLSASNPGRLVVVAKPIDSKDPRAHNRSIKGRRFTISPSGEMSNNDTAYPACVNEGTFEILS
jgi:hypothetical protein